jgi:hypothetical protein
MDRLWNSFTGDIERLKIVLRDMIGGRRILRHYAVGVRLIHVSITEADEDGKTYEVKE